MEKDRRDGYDSFCFKLTQANGGDAYPDFYYWEIGDEFHWRPLDNLEVHVNQGWREAYVPGSSRRRSLDRIRDAARQYSAVASFTLPRAGALPSSPQLQGVPEEVARCDRGRWYGLGVPWAEWVDVARMLPLRMRRKR